MLVSTVGKKLNERVISEDDLLRWHFCDSLSDIICSNTMHQMIMITRFDFALLSYDTKPIPSMWQCSDAYMHTEPTTAACWLASTDRRCGDRRCVPCLTTAPRDHTAGP